MIRNKTILVIDDVISSGETADNVADSLETYEPIEIYFACVQRHKPMQNYEGFKKISESKNFYLFEKI